jgi:uncharacterized Zn finger protein
MKLKLNNKKIIHASCSCKGGATGKCKHSVALMITLSR